MRENRMHGSEGGEGNHPFRPLSSCQKAKYHLTTDILDFSGLVVKVFNTILNILEVTRPIG